MKQPVPARGNPPAPRDPTRHTSLDLTVRFYDRMRPQRVYPLTVEVPRGAAPRPAHGLTLEPVVVRPVIPGALVTPPERRLDVTRPGERATFAVTALARGRFPAPRVEIVQHGRPAQEVPLRMKGVSQRLTWALLALTLLVTGGVFYLTRWAPFKGEIPYPTKQVDIPAAPNAPKPAGEPNPPAGNGQKASDQEAARFDRSNLLVRADDPEKKTEQPAAKDKTAKDKDAKDTAKKDTKDEDTAKKDSKDENAAKKENKDEKAEKGKTEKTDKAAPAPAAGKEAAPPAPGAEGPPGPPGAPGRGRIRRQIPGGVPGGAPLPEPATQTLVAGSPGDVLQYRFQREMSDLFGEVPVLSDRVVPTVGGGLSFGYDMACNLRGTYFWVGVVLLALTFVSCLVHRSHRTWRRARIDLAMTPASPHAQETLPLNPPDVRPVSVEPA